MNFRIIKTVIAREYLTRVKKKSFIVTTILVPLIFAATMIIVGLIMVFLTESSGDTTTRTSFPYSSRRALTESGFSEE